MGLKEKLKNIIVLDSTDKMEHPINSFVGYEYIIASNGVFVRAENDFFKVCFQISNCEIRNLFECKEYFVMKNKMPKTIFEQIEQEIEKGDTTKEKFLQIVYENGKYSIYTPKQKGDAGSVVYLSNKDTVVLEFHTHPQMDAFFSDIDDRDEQGFKLYGVYSVINGKCSDYIIRLSVYGYYLNISRFWISKGDNYDE